MKSRAFRSVQITLLALFLAMGSGLACLPGGDGSGGSGDPDSPQFGESEDQNSFPSGDESEDLENTRITLTPPPSLTLDGQAVESGEFMVESATAYMFSGQDSSSERVVTTPVIISAEIGTGVHDLFEVPGKTEAIDIKGSFQATTPALPAAHFNITVFGDFSEPIEFTVFLPENTADEFVQISGATQTATENVDIFSDDPLDPESYSEVVESSSSPGRIDPATPALNLPETSAPRTHHGQVGAVPLVRQRNPNSEIDESYLDTSQIEQDCYTTRDNAFACPDGPSTPADEVCLLGAYSLGHIESLYENPEQCVAEGELFSACRAGLGCDGLRAHYSGDGDDPCKSEKDAFEQACTKRN